MRQLAQRIERVFRTSFLTKEEALTVEGQRSFEDRQKIISMTQEFASQGYSLPIARQIAYEEWLTNFLMENCIKCDGKNL
jgi:hypothetical protein